MTGFAYTAFLFSMIIISSLCAGISSGLISINKYQLKRKAQFNDHDAKLVYSLYSIRYEVLSTLLILNILTNTTIVVLVDAAIGGFFAVLFSTFLILFFGELLPMIYIKKNVVFVAARAYPFLDRLVRLFSPITRLLGRVFNTWIGDDTQVFYSREELQRMFDGQKLSENSDIATDEARMIRQVLGFGERKVRDVMTPRRMAKMIVESEKVGPVLLTELHESGHSRFPVTTGKGRGTHFVGTLYMRDLVGDTKAKLVSELMSKDVRYMHEEESLDNALRAFLKTHHHLFVVVNTFEEFVGVITIEDVLEEIIGKEIVDEFDQYEDLREVAQLIAKKEAKQHKTQLTSAEAKSHTEPKDGALKEAEEPKDSQEDETKK